MQHEEFYTQHLTTEQKKLYNAFKMNYNAQSAYKKRLYMDMSIILTRFEQHLYNEVLKLIYIM